MPEYPATQGLVSFDGQTGAVTLANTDLDRVRKIVSKTANYTAADGDYVVGDTTGGGFTVTLPAAAAGAYIVVELRTGSGTLTVHNLLGGDALLTGTRAGMMCFSDGTNWHGIPVQGAGTFAPLIDAVATYGADPTGVSDSAPAIRNAIAAAAASSSIKKVYLRPGTYLINSSIRLGNGTAAIIGDAVDAVSTYGGVSLVSSGAPWGAGSLGDWLSADGGAILLAGPGLTTGAILEVVGISGWWLENIAFDGGANGAANGLIGVRKTSVMNGGWKNVAFRRLLWADRAQTMKAGVGQSGNPPSTQYNTYQNTNILVPGQTGAIGIFLAGPGDATPNVDTHHETYRDTLILWGGNPSSGVLTGIKLGAADTSTFDGLTIYPRTFATGNAVEFAYGNSTSAAWPSACRFVNFDPNAQFLINTGSPVSAFPNVVGTTSTDGAGPWLLGPAGAASLNLANLVFSALPYGDPGSLPVPAVPASGVTWTNNFDQPVMVYVTAGSAAMVISVRGNTAGTLPANGFGTFKLFPGDTIAWTGTVAPTWWVHPG